MGSEHEASGDEPTVGASPPTPPSETTGWAAPGASWTPTRSWSRSDALPRSPVPTSAAWVDETQLDAVDSDARAGDEALAGPWAGGQNAMRRLGTARARWLVIGAAALAVGAVASMVILGDSSAPSILDRQNRVRTYADSPDAAWTFSIGDPAGSDVSFGVNLPVDGGPTRLVLVATTDAATGFDVKIDGLVRATGASAWQLKPTVDGASAKVVTCVPTSGHDRVVCLAALGFGDAGPGSLLTIDTENGRLLKTVELAAEDGPWQLIEGADDDAFLVGGKSFDDVANDSGGNDSVPPDGPITLARYAGASLDRTWSQQLTTAQDDPVSSVYLMSIGHGTLFQFDGAGWATIDVATGARKGRRDWTRSEGSDVTVDLRTDSMIIEYDPRSAATGVTAYDLDAHPRWSAADLRYIGSRGLWQGSGPVLAADSRRDQLVALDPESGDELWRRDDTEEDAFVVANVDGLLIVAAGSGAVQSLDPTDGDLIWTAVLDTLSIYQMFLSPEHIYVVVRGELHALDRSTGREAWTRSIGSDVLSAVGDDLVLVGDDSLVLLR